MKKSASDKGNECSPIDAQYNSGQCLLSYLKVGLKAAQTEHQVEKQVFFILKVFTKYL